MLVTRGEESWQKRPPPLMTAELPGDGAVFKIGFGVLEAGQGTAVSGVISVEGGVGEYRSWPGNRKTRLRQNQYSPQRSCF